MKDKAETYSKYAIDESVMQYIATMRDYGFSLVKGVSLDDTLTSVFSCYEGADLVQVVLVCR